MCILGWGICHSGPWFVIWSSKKHVTCWIKLSLGSAPIGISIDEELGLELLTFAHGLHPTVLAQQDSCPAICLLRASCSSSCWDWNSKETQNGLCCSASWGPTNALPPITDFVMVTCWPLPEITDTSVALKEFMSGILRLLERERGNKQLSFHLLQIKIRISLYYNYHPQSTVGKKAGKHKRTCILVAINSMRTGYLNKFV